VRGPFKIPGAGGSEELGFVRLELYDALPQLLDFGPEGRKALVAPGPLGARSASARTG